MGIAALNPSYGLEHFGETQGSMTSATGRGRV
jgi:hypothetical protein